MNADTTTQNPFPTSGESTGTGGTDGLNGDANKVHRLAQSLHEAVDTLEQKIGTSSDRVMSMQQEYGDLAREQVRSNPLGALAVAFAAGFIVARILR